MYINICVLSQVWLMMGGEQSHETKEREEEKQEVSAGPDGSGPAASEGSASEGMYSDTVGESNWVYLSNCIVLLFHWMSEGNVLLFI